ncbi:MAG: acyloxyacyl hydrolase [Burkholderiales bacterium]
MPTRFSGIAARSLLPSVAAVAVLAAASAYGASSYLPESLTATVGYSEDVVVYGIGARWAPKTQIDFLDSRRLQLLVDAQAAYWLGRGTPTPYGHVWDFSVTPMVRWRPASPEARALYIEGGIGIRALTATRINNDRQFGIAFQFGEQLGIGASFGPHDDYEVGLYVQHVSNADIKPRANWGLTYPGLVVRAKLP